MTCYDRVTIMIHSHIHRLSVQIEKALHQSNSSTEMRNMQWVLFFLLVTVFMVPSESCGRTPVETCKGLPPGSCFGDEVNRTRMCCVCCDDSCGRENERSNEREGAGPQPAQLSQAWNWFTTSLDPAKIGQEKTVENFPAHPNPFLPKGQA